MMLKLPIRRLLSIPFPLFSTNPKPTNKSTTTSSSAPSPSSPSYSQVLNKLIVTRTPNQKYSLFLPTQTTLSEFLEQLRLLFPEHKSNIGITTNPALLNPLSTLKIESQKQHEQQQQMKDIALVTAIILNKLLVYEKGPDGNLLLVYGVQISEYNMSNRLNIPEYIEEGIVDMYGEWEEAPNLTVANGLAFTNIRKYQQGPLTKQQGATLENSLTQPQSQSLQESLQTLASIKSFNQQAGPYLPTTNKLMTKILAYMSVNWVFLFYLTYGKYGWDVGEPVSYLTGLSIDLIAMMGLFEANRALISQKEKDKQLIQIITNMKASEDMAKWRIAYLTRKLS